MEDWGQGGFVTFRETQLSLRTKKLKWQHDGGEKKNCEMTNSEEKNKI